SALRLGADFGSELHRRLGSGLGLATDRAGFLGVLRRGRRGVLRWRASAPPLFGRRWKGDGLMFIRTEAELGQVEDALRKTMDFALDTETVDEGYPDIHLVGVSLSWGKDIGCYIPVGHSTGEIQLPQETLVEMLK